MITDKMKAEAITRMRLLGLAKKVIEDFYKEQIVYVSDLKNVALHIANEYEKEIIDKCEQEHNCLIFHGIHEKTKCKDNLYLLYVGANENEWKDEQKDIMLGFTTVHAYKRTKEIREIGIRVSNGRINCIRN